MHDNPKTQSEKHIERVLPFAYKCIKLPKQIDPLNLAPTPHFFFPDLINFGNVRETAKTDFNLKKIKIPTLYK